MIGMRASAWLRCAWGLGFCVAAVALVWIVEREGQVAARTLVVTAPAALLRLPLEVQSTYPVVRWRVLVLGAEQAPTASDQWTWHGQVSVPSHEDVVVIATAELATAAPHRGLRLRLGDAPERLVWGAGDVVATEPAP